MGGPRFQRNFEGKVFVGGLGPETTTEGLKHFFSAYGTLTDCVVMMRPDFATGERRSRGFGFVTFQDPHMATVVVNQGKIVVENKTVEVKHADEGKNYRGKGRQPADRGRKAFVGGLPDAVTTSQLKEYFLTIDPNLEDAHVAMHPQTGMSRRFGYITFSNPGFMQKAMQMRNDHYIGEKWVDVKPRR